MEYPCRYLLVCRCVDTVGVAICEEEVPSLYGFEIIY